MAKEFKTLDEALEAQAKQKKEVEKVKKELTTYFTKNKLKRNEDYTDDPKHGPKIAKLEKEIDKKEETMAKVNEQVKNLEKGKKGKAAKTEKAAKGKKAKESKGGEGRTTKYEYPADCDTPQKKKAYRVAARAAEKKGEDAPGSYKEVMEAKNAKASKKETKAKTKEKEKPAKEEKKTKGKAKKEEAPAKGKAKAKTKEKEKPAKKKKTKKVEDD